MSTALAIQFLAQLPVGLQCRLEPGGPIYNKDHEYPSTGNCRLIDEQTRKPKILPGRTSVYPAQD